MSDFRIETTISEPVENTGSVSLNATQSIRADGIFQLARAFLSIEPMTNKKLQKLCYYAKAWYLAINDENLIPEQFQAWVHGAVSPELYRKYRDYGFEKIPQETDVSDIPETFMDFAKDIFAVYGKYTGDQLEYINHRESPWLNARKGLEPWENSENIISESDMKECYRKRIKTSTDER